VLVFRGQFVIAYKKEIEDKTNPAAVKNFRLCEEGQHYKGLPERVINLALEAASRFDLDLLGVDLIYPGDRLTGQDGYVLEVNSAPGFGTQFTIPRLLKMINQSCES
jgi:glutathione synthase/RimK-type ligase-like ATP-grasp enzyme